MQMSSWASIEWTKRHRFPVWPILCASHSVADAIVAQQHCVHMISLWQAQQEQEVQMVMNGC
jgi:hypothetical protein